MQGIFINGHRPKSKKEVKEAVKLINELSDAKPMTVGAIMSVKVPRVSAEATSIFGGEFNGPIENMPDNTEITFVGPDPYTKRNFYGTIKKVNGKLKVS